MLCSHIKPVIRQPHLVVKIPLLPDCVAKILLLPDFVAKILLLPDFVVKFYFCQILLPKLRIFLMLPPATPLLPSNSENVCECCKFEVSLWALSLWFTWTGDLLTHGQGTDPTWRWGRVISCPFGFWERLEKPPAPQSHCGRYFWCQTLLPRGAPGSFQGRRGQRAVWGRVS